MVKVRVEFWMWQGKELGPEFVSSTDARARLETDVAEGTTVRQLFEQLAERYPIIEAKVFSDHQLQKYMIATLNHEGMAREELMEKVLRDGDVIAAMPIYVGG